MVRRMRELPGDHPCWTFDRNNQTAGFWHRRQMHELAVHRWDLERAPPRPSRSPQTASTRSSTSSLPRMLKAGRATLPDGSLELVSPVRTWTDRQPASRWHRCKAPPGTCCWRCGAATTLLPPVWRDAKLMP